MLGGTKGGTAAASDCEAMGSAAAASFKSGPAGPKIDARARLDCLSLSDASATILDADALQRLRDLDPRGKNHLLERVLAAFETSAIRLSRQLVEARRGKNMDGVRLVAHTLKSSSASIGALTLSRLCAEIETQLRTGALSGLDDRLDAMDRELGAVLEAVSPLLKPLQ